MNSLKRSVIWKIAAALLLVFLLVVFYKKMITQKLSQSQYAEVKDDGYYQLVMQNWTDHCKKRIMSSVLLIFEKKEKLTKSFHLGIATEDIVDHSGKMMARNVGNKNNTLDMI